MANTQTIQNRGLKYRLKEPPQYHVILHNDDFTTMDFVVMILMNIFHKTQAQAETLMLKVHHEGSAIAGTYSRDIAESKAAKATALARANGFPLVLTTEEAYT